MRYSAAALEAQHGDDGAGDILYVHVVADCLERVNFAQRFHACDSHVSDPVRAVPEVRLAVGRSMVP